MMPPVACLKVTFTITPPVLSYRPPTPERATPLSVRLVRLSAITHTRLRLAAAARRPALTRI